MPVSRSIAVVSVVSLADTATPATTTPKPSSEEQLWLNALKSVTHQADQPLPPDNLQKFDSKAKAKANLRRLSDVDPKVRMQTWGRHALPNGMQKFQMWFTLQGELYPKLASMAAAIRDKYELDKKGRNGFRVDLSNQMNRALGMKIDVGVEEKDIRKIYSADIVIQQADPDKKGTPDDRNPGFFRPCMSSPSIDTTQCVFDKDHPKGAYKWIQDWITTAWDMEHPDDAYPFTAEGWTYNYNKESSDKVGFQEYVLPAYGSDLEFHVPNQAGKPDLVPSGKEAGYVQGTPIVESLCDYCDDWGHSDSNCSKISDIVHTPEGGCKASADTLLIV